MEMPTPLVVKCVKLVNNNNKVNLLFNIWKVNHPLFKFSITIGIKSSKVFNRIR